MTVTHGYAQVNSVPVTTVSGASFERVALAPGSLASAFGTKLATQTVTASDIDPSTPAIDLPTNLGGTTVQVDGQLAGILFVSPLQVNFLLPTGAAQGMVTVKIIAGDGTESTGTVTIARVQPAIFTFNANGHGVLAAEVVRVKADGTQLRESLATRNPVTNQFVTKPIAFGAATDRIFLEIYLTGMRGVLDNNSDGNLNENVWVILGGQVLEPSYAGRQPLFVGLDQVNVELPRSLSGKGKMNLVVQARQGTSPSFSDPSVTSGRVELEVGNANPGPLPTISNLSATRASVGETLFVTGTGFAPNVADNVVTIGGVKAGVELVADSTRMVVRVPFGAVSGRVKVVTPQGESTNLIALNIQTSVSGYLETTNLADVFPAPLRNLTVRVAGTNISTVTNAEGVFTLPDVPAGEVVLEVEPTAFPVSGVFPKVSFPLNVIAARDNFLPHSIWLTTTGLVAEKAGAGVTSVIGVVYDLDGITPVPHARVRTYDEGFHQVTTTDDSGTFIFRNVPMSLALRLVAEVVRDGRVFRVRTQTTTQRAIGFINFPVVANLSLKDAPTNRVPLLIVPASITMNVGETKDVTIFADDPDPGESLQVAASSPVSLSLLPATNGAYNVRLKPLAGGTFTVSVTVTDGQGQQVTQTFGLTVVAPNAAPTITVPAAQRVNTGQALTLNISAADADAGQTIRLSASGLPSGATFTQTATNPPTGTFTWTPDSNQIGTYNVQFTAQDNGFGTLSDSKTVTITVSGPLPAGVWTRISSSLPDIVTTATVDGNDIYAGVYANGVYVTSDYGVMWRRISNGLPTATVRALSVNGQTLFAASDAGVYRSLDKGETWMLVNANFKTLRTAFARQADRIVVFDRNRAVLSADQGTTWLPLAESSTEYVVATDGRGTVFVRGSNDNIYLLEGSGTAINLRPAILFPGRMPTTVGTTTSKMFIATKNPNPEIDYVYASTDSGINWLDVSASFPVAAYRSLYGVGNRLFALTNNNGGQFVSNDGGATWSVLAWPYVEILVSNQNYLLATTGESLLVMPLP